MYTSSGQYAQPSDICDYFKILDNHSTTDFRHIGQCASAVQSCLHDESSFALAAGSHAPALLWVWMRCILQMAHPMGVKHLISLVWLKMM